MVYLLDTNIVLTILRSKEKARVIERQTGVFLAAHTPIISVVTIGEILSIAKRNKWGKQRITLLQNILHKFLVVDIGNEKILDEYAQIDAFSQGKLDGKPLNTTARNMGKNDLWIAATASVANATLVTTDNDFNHLQGTFLDLILIQL